MERRSEIERGSVLRTPARIASGEAAQLALDFMDPLTAVSVIQPGSLHCFQYGYRDLDGPNCTVTT